MRYASGRWVEMGMKRKSSADVNLARTIYGNLDDNYWTLLDNSPQSG